VSMATWPTSMRAANGACSSRSACWCVWPVLTLRLPLPALGSSARKRFLEKRFVDEIAERHTFAPVRPLLEAMIRTGAQMSYLGYYGDERAAKAIGYVPFSERAQVHPGGPPAPPLRSVGVLPRDARYDAVIVGSGAAGSFLALRFAQAGRRVLVLERGPHVDPRQFTEDEVERCAQERSGLDLLADVEVERIVHDGDKAVGVMGRHGSGEQISVTRVRRVPHAARAGRARASGADERGPADDQRPSARRERARRRCRRGFPRARL
jgi:hypothetical protein